VARVTIRVASSSSSSRNGVMPSSFIFRMKAVKLLLEHYNENSFARAFGGDSGTANARGESPPGPPSLYIAIIELLLFWAG
jgi:hypothetical protein